MKIIKKIVPRILLVFLIAIVALLIFFNWPTKRENENVKFGITFSARYANDIHLDWKKVYLVILDDLGAKKIRLPIYWDLTEKTSGEYDFSDIDWQLDEAQKRNAEVILVIGQKVPRWPECAIPLWLKDDDEKRKESLLKFLGVIVERYKDNETIKYWQVENEPFLPFGICPDLDVDFLDKEIAKVRSIDQSKKIIITDSGELSLWVRAAKRADVFGTTMYRTIWKKGLGYFDYPIGPRFFQFKYFLNKKIAKQDKIMVIELQGEPWISGYTTSEPLSEQFKSMNAEKLKDNVAFARRVGFPEVYLWGVEWWYWLKMEQGHSELWEEAKSLFNEGK
ncbi:MAG TPA: cellulase family glycosylhydrolase [Candidatus Moranbacteria bacterium]|nr:cellulase family glycosylhydrolase [Candidatus Moranbacteria bacterium]